MSNDNRIEITYAKNGIIVTHASYIDADGATVYTDDKELFLRKAHALKRIKELIEAQTSLD